MRTGARGALLAGAALLRLALAAAPAAALPPDPLPGRLFHTPQERAALDRPPAPAAQPPAPRRAPAPVVRPERSDALSGFVLRSDGHDSFWLDTTPPAPAALRR